MREHGDENRGEFDGRTYLLIRTNPLDNGDEPRPPGMALWVSPDIVLTPPGGPPGDQAKAGVDNQLDVTVTNLGGITAPAAFVDVFMCGPTTGWTPATASLVASGVLSVPGYGNATAHFSWNPPPSEAGHRCLMARVSSVITGDTYTDPTIFDVLNDRHIAQRNIHVIEMTTAMNMVSFGFLVVNPVGRPANFVMRAGPLRPTQAMLRQARGALCGFANFAEARPRVRLGLGEAFVAHDPTEGRLNPRLPALGTLRQESRLRLPPRGALRLEEGEVRYATVTVERAREARPGEVQIVEVAQFDAETARQVGGLWLALKH